jgi:menaquinone-dependent protoporphyrinogen oxidase
MAVFAGALLYSRYAWHERLIIRLIMWITNGPTDTSRDVDFTDWDRVRRFSNSVFE